MRLILAITSVLMAASSLFSADIAFPPVGQHKVDLLVAGIDLKSEAIGRKLRQSLALDPVWLESYVKESSPKPGEPLPYHPKMGITEDEYTSFVDAARNMSLRKVADATVAVGEAQGKISIHITGVALPCDSFEFSSDGMSMKCSLGTSGAPIAIDQNDESAPTGAWTGNQWIVTQGSLTPSLLGKKDAYQVKFAIGKDSKSRNLIYLRIVGRQNKSPVDIAYVLRWPQ